MVHLWLWVAVKWVVVRMMKEMEQRQRLHGNRGLRSEAKQSDTTKLTLQKRKKKTGEKKNIFFFSILS